MVCTFLGGQIAGCLSSKEGAYLENAKSNGRIAGTAIGLPICIALIVIGLYGLMQQPTWLPKNVALGLVVVGIVDPILAVFVHCTSLCCVCTPRKERPKQGQENEQRRERSCLEDDNNPGCCFLSIFV